jgi:hypothetical protein
MSQVSHFPANSLLLGEKSEFQRLVTCSECSRSVEGVVHRTVLLAPIGQESRSWHCTRAWIRTRAPSRCLRHAIYGFKPLSGGNRVLRAAVSFWPSSCRCSIRDRRCRADLRHICRPRSSTFRMLRPVCLVGERYDSAEYARNTLAVSGLKQDR